MDWHGWRMEATHITNTYWTLFSVLTLPKFASDMHSIKNTNAAKAQNRCVCVYLHCLFSWGLHPCGDTAHISVGLKKKQKIKKEKVRNYFDLCEHWNATGFPGLEPELACGHEWKGKIPSHQLQNYEKRFLKSNAAQTLDMWLPQAASFHINPSQLEPDAAQKIWAQTQARISTVWSGVGEDTGEFQSSNRQQREHPLAFSTC